jgi:hypothetical protein
VVWHPRTNHLSVAAHLEYVGPGEHGFDMFASTDPRALATSPPTDTRAQPAIQVPLNADACLVTDKQPIPLTSWAQSSSLK